jgi:hypothetical protein
MKKSPIVAGLILCALMAIVVGVWAWTGRTGTTQVEQWVGRHLVEALQSRINPRITWQSLDYRAPLTVVVDGLQIEDSGLAILKAQSLTLGLAETPRPNEPIRIERVELDSPTFQFVDGPGGELIGWSHFIRRPAEEHGQAAGLDDRLHLRHLLMRHAAQRRSTAPPRRTIRAGTTSRPTRRSRAWFTSSSTAGWRRARQISCWSRCTCPRGWPNRNSKS